MFFNVQEGNLYVVNKNNGEIKWEFKTQGTTYSRAILAEDILYFGSGDGNLYAFELNTGKQLWKFTAGSGIHRMTINNGVIFFGSGNYMYAIE